jgi:hypothetical protein
MRLCVQIEGKEVCFAVPMANKPQFPGPDPEPWIVGVPAEVAHELQVISTMADLARHISEPHRGTLKRVLQNAVEPLMRHLPPSNLHGGPGPDPFM